MGALVRNIMPERPAELLSAVSEQLHIVALRQRSSAGRLVVASDKPSSVEKRLASGPLQGSELQGCTLVVSRYAGIAVFRGLIMALTFDPYKPLKTRGGGRGSKLTLCGTRLTRETRVAY
jgi:hypothetical protein